ncbi:nucleotide exchange factor GrpE [Streptomyces sp. NBC_01167]|uniref:nucleotide exchange factor GrpE n=1 Tax=Streptomyces sp. NBC_01167 TaxID=2903756 RepID=UPI0038652466|nr:nucleotide exchange factor GrpE [Streptomyces sp. NBC_01167]
MSTEPDPVGPEEVPPGAPSREEGPHDQGPQAGAPQDQGAPEQSTVDEHAAELEEVRDRWHRALADLDNLRKRHAKELGRAHSDERARTAASWLPVLDNLELALTHAVSDPTPVLEGVKAVRDQAVEVLRSLGYARYEDTGVPFDPVRHEVVGVVEDPAAEPNTVVQVVRPGYGEDERQLRPASVVVSKRQE